MSEPTETKPTQEQKPVAPVAPAADGQEELNPDGTPLSDNQKKKRAKQAEKERLKAEKAAKVQQQEAQRQADEVDFASQNYGELPLNQSQERHGRTYASLEDVKAENDGKDIFFSARIQTSRTPSAKFVFLTLRHAFFCVQAVLAQAPEKVSKQMVKWAATLPSESIVQVQGTISKVSKPIESSTVTNKDAEIKVSKIFLVSKVAPSAPQPFYVDDATRSEAEIEASQSTDRPMPGIPMDLRLDNRILDLRTTTNQAIFRVQHGISKLFREYLEQREFVEIHTPKLQGAATESGASVFKVSYFKGNAFLAQSPQLHKQMAIAADFGKVYEIGPVFRAEDSNTPRHMTEFMGLDLEMAFDEHYHEVLELLGDLFLFIFRELPKRYSKEIATVRKQFPSDDFLVPDKLVRLEFPEAVKMLREAGQELGDYDDLSTEQERVLGKIVREKYQSDFFMLDKFPMAVRPFYTMPDPKDENYSNSYDFFMRGQEIMSGAQRVHDADLLVKQMAKVGISEESMQHYVEGFRMGCPPHAGGGIGLERVLMFFLGITNIRRTSMFPRDPKRLAP
ncbi:aspartyl-tRNA synthetase [Jaminaea rosea]|uniref:Aspartate--tRNA ligase, cytoplasmic n=1 Tax=Jaminaea rosea TaxID=1569628 RepID=A0A316UPZ6_9BASI|nr:aspartyl-tRNA synthetase [Jaminaea rosea]PWN27044.1 aspartyl-tRNA synthetase [Jaminaea rosea]